MITFIHLVPSLTVLSGQPSSISGWPKPSSLAHTFLLWGRPELQAGPGQDLMLPHLSTCVVQASEVSAVLGVSHSTSNPRAGTTLNRAHQQPHCFDNGIFSSGSSS